MEIENLVKEAWEAWFGYGEVIKEKFCFPKDSRIVADELLKVVNTGDEERIHSFILWVKEQTQNMNTMRGFNE